MARRGKLIAMASGLLGAGVLVGAGFAFKDRVLEAYWLRQLDSKEVGTREKAAERLGYLRSAEAVPRLIELASERGAGPMACTGRPPREDPYTAAIVHIGAPAVPALLQALERASIESYIVVLVAAYGIGPPALPVLRLAGKGSMDEVHRPAATAPPPVVR